MMTGLPRKQRDTLTYSGQIIKDRQRGRIGRLPFKFGLEQTQLRLATKPILRILVADNDIVANVAVYRVAGESVVSK